MRKIQTMPALFALLLVVALAACSGGGNGESSPSAGGAEPVAVPSAEPAPSESAKASEAKPSEDGEPACGEELLKKLPSKLPFPEDAYFFSVCEDSNEYGSGIAVSYQTTGEAAMLAKTYRDALEGEYEYGGMDVLDFVTMQFTKGEEAIVVEIDASGGDGKLIVNLSHGIYPGGYDNALGGVLEEIAE